MARHLSNIKAFVDSAKSSADPIVKAYCGLVAVELILKESTGLKNHDIPAAITKFSHLFAINHLSGCKIRINSLVLQLKRDLTLIIVQDIDQTPIPAPTVSYPYIRYVRYQSDGWPPPSTTSQQAQNLANTVAQIQAYLKEKFNKEL